MKVRRVGYLLAVAAAVFAALVVAGPASADSAICGTSVATNVTLTGNISCATTNAPAITVVASGVTINLNGYTITGNNSYDVIDADWMCGSGSDRCDNVTVENGTITNGEDQVAFGGDDNTATNLTLNSTDDGVSYGVYVDEGAGNLVTGNTISGADGYDGYGVYLFKGAGNTVLQNTIGPAVGSYGESNYYGVYAYQENGSTITDNYVLKSWEEGIYDSESDLDTYSDNVVSGNGSEGIYVDGGSSYYGTAMVVGNASRANDGYGIEVDDSFNEADESGVTPPYTMVSGNYANSNADGGFESDYSLDATWQNNSAGWNTGDGYTFYYGDNATYTGNTAKYNTGDGFYWEYTYPPYTAQSVTNNSSTYNGDYGFYVDEYAQAGSGNTGGGTNTSGDCYGLSGCS